MGRDIDDEEYYEEEKDQESEEPQLTWSQRAAANYLSSYLVPDKPVYFILRDVQGRDINDVWVVSLHILFGDMYLFSVTHQVGILLGLRVKAAQTTKEIGLCYEGSGTDIAYDILSLLWNTLYPDEQTRPKSPRPIWI